MESKNLYSKENGSFDCGLAPFAQDDNQERKRIENSVILSERSGVEESVNQEAVI